MEILNIKFKPNEDKFVELQELFNSIGEEALYMTHYELAEATEESPILWKQFIMDPRVSAIIAEELELLKRSKVAVMLREVDTNRNTGQAQLLNTLLNQTKGQEKKDGPVFIYTQIPLNVEEQEAPNVRVYQANKHESNE